MIKTEMLRVFIEVARAGNLSTAAEALERVPSAVSMTLKQLEEHLGKPLFETGRKSRLTPLGAFVLELAEREISQVDRTRAALADFANARIGDARIACVPSFSVALLPGLVAAFAKASPGVRLDIRDLDSGAILRELERERIDVGIVSNAQPNPKLHRTELSTDAFGLFLRDDHPLAARERVRWREIADLALIANPLCDRLDVPGLLLALAAARMRARNTTTLLALVAAGLGVTVLPALVSRDAGTGRLPASGRTRAHAEHRHALAGGRHAEPRRVSIHPVHHGVGRRRGRPGVARDGMIAFLAGDQEADADRPGPRRLTERQLNQPIAARSA